MKTTKLDYRKVDDHYWMSIEERDNLTKKYILSEIENRANILVNKNQEIKNMEYEKSLIEQDIAEILESDVHLSAINVFYPYSFQAIITAWEAQKNEKAKEEDKFALECILTCIQEKILKTKNKFKFREMTSVNYHEKFSFEYEYQGIVFRIDCPIFEKATKENFFEILEGYAVYHQTSDSGWTSVCFDLDLDKLSEKLHNWLKKETKEIKKNGKKNN